MGREVSYILAHPSVRMPLKRNTGEDIDNNDEEEMLNGDE
jgi:hypothetical protein